MNCLKCASPNPDSANYCSQCGDPISGIAFNQADKTKNSLALLVILTAWEIFLGIIWLIIQKGLVPLLTDSSDYTSYARVTVVYQAAGWLFSLVSIALGITFSILARNKAARIIFIIYAVMAFIGLIVYQVAALFS